MSKKIYVGNLSYDTQESAVAELFATHGEVLSTKLIEDRYTGRSKGFAFVEMANDDDANSAISALNGKEVDGRNIKVNEAIDRPKKNNFRRDY